MFNFLICLLLLIFLFGVFCWISNEVLLVLIILLDDVLVINFGFIGFFFLEVGILLLRNLNNLLLFLFFVFVIFGGVLELEEGSRDLIGIVGLFRK